VIARRDVKTTKEGGRMRFRFGAMRFLFGVAVGAVLAAGAGVAVASMSDAGGQINACYTRDNLRVLVAGTCKKHETAISWNEAGPVGPPGATGPAGPPGPAGSLDTTEVASSGTNTISPGTTTDAVAVCPEGMIAVAGGFEVRPHLAPPVVVTSTRRSDDSRRWDVLAFNPGTAFDKHVVAIAYCAQTS
jgi:hypothetical protein